MKYLSILTYMIFSISGLIGQTYSKKYVLNNFEENFIKDMKVSGSKIHFGVSHFCDPDTTDNSRIKCLGYYEIDFQGVLQNELLFDTLFPVGSSSLLVTNENIYLTSNRHGQSLGRPTSIVNVEEGRILDIYALDTSLTPTSEGIFLFDECFYLSGTETDTDINRAYASIQKLDKEFNVVWSTNYARGKVGNSCFSFQPTPDGNLIYINDYNGGAGAEGTSGVEIVKLDTSGNMIDTLNMEDLRVNRDSRLLSARDETFYMTTRDPIVKEGIQVVEYNGTINKISATMDSFIWSTPLPVKAFSNGRSYRFYDIKEARNGDIIAAGEAWDNNFDGILNNGHMSNWNGFAVRLDALTGDIIWLRVYQQPIENPLLDAVEHGGHISGIIKNVHELADGRLVFGGSSYHDGQQQSVLKPAGETVSFLWLMITDENGCINGEECSENIMLDGEYRPTDGFLPYIDTSSIWIQSDCGPTSFISVHLSFAADSVWENGWYRERLISDSENGSFPFREGLYKETNGVVFKKTGSGVQEESIFLDMTMIIGDSILYQFDEEPIILFATEVDTVLYLDQVPRKRIALQSKENIGSENFLSWVEGIGPLEPFNTCNFSDEGYEDLRCMLQDELKVYESDFIIESNGGDCWVTTNTIEFLSNINIHPNPVKDILKIDSEQKIHTYKLYNTMGSLLKSGVLQSQELTTKELIKGNYYLQLFDDEGRSQTLKFLKE